MRPDYAQNRPVLRPYPAMDWAQSGRIGGQSGYWQRQASAAVFRFGFGFTWSLRDSCSKIQHTPVKVLC